VKNKKNRVFDEEYLLNCSDREAEENFLLDFVEQTIIVQLHILNEHILDQLKQPMVLDSENDEMSKELFLVFKMQINAMLECLVNSRLITDDFLEKSKLYLSESLKLNNIPYSYEVLYKISFDIGYMLSVFIRYAIGSNPWPKNSHMEDFFYIKGEELMRRYDAKYSQR